ncbi:MAG: hypothetical protein JOZ69_10295 [Myxococcales bacterium]|nr:hypothetical protein [Myxococcales bacterium]
MVFLVAAGAVVLKVWGARSQAVSMPAPVPIALRSSAQAGEPRRPQGAATATRGLLHTTNSAGRAGAYLLPAGFPGRPLPVLVAIHGTGGNGAGLVGFLASAAEDNGLIVVAPDSRVAPDGQATWEVPNAPGDTTEDLAHIQRCVAEVRAMPGVVMDTTRTIIMGHSGGGSTAPYAASDDDFYTAFAVLHGGVFVGGLGARRPRGWFSTGDQDPWRPPSSVEAAALAARAVGFATIEYRTFHAGHELGPEELRAVLAWWLGHRE